MSPATALNATPAMPVVAPRTPAADGNMAATRKSAEDFTAFFFTQSLETIYSGLSSDTMFGGGSGENIYRSMMTQEYGKIAATSGSGVGIADSVQREMLRMQEKK